VALSLTTPTLIDTAGIRCKARVSEALEKFSIIKALQSIESAQVAVVMIDAQAGVTDQDVTVLRSKAKSPDG
jgi:GTPase